MTTPGGPIATEYIEIRPSPATKQAFKRELEEALEPSAKHVQGRVGKAVSDGLKTPAGAAAAGAATGVVLGRGISAGLQTVLRGLTAVPRTGFAELSDYQAGLAQLNAGLKSTGGVAGLTARDLEELAGSVQKYSGQTDDSIVRAESFLLTFDKIRDSLGKGNDVFTRTTKATADLAARFGGEASDKAVMLGKALQDPARGLTALTRAGIVFTDQQRKTIVSLDSSGRSLEAQKLILAEVEKQVGGSAKAYGETLPGEIDRAKRAFEDISQSIVGTTFSFVDHNRKTAAAVAGVVGGIYVAHKAVRAYQALQETLLAGTAKKVAGNVALARSYDGVAASAGRAAEAETIAARGGVGGGAGVPPVVAGGTRPPGLGTTGALAFLAAGAFPDLRFPEKDLPQVQKAILGIARSHGGDSKVLAEADRAINNQTRQIEFLRKYGRNNKEAQKLLADLAPSVVAGGAALPTGLTGRLAGAAADLAAARGVYADPTKRAAEAQSLAGTLSSPFATAADRHPDLVAAREAQRQADQDVREAQRRLASVGGGGATAAQLAAAEASVASRQAALRKRGGDPTSERLGLEAAEARLADLRGKGGRNTDAVRQAEEKLTESRRKAKQAAADVAKAEQGTALSTKAILDRISGQLGNARALRDDSRKLIADGVSGPVLEELYKLERDAPGTLDKVAKGLTPAMAKQLNSQYGDLQKVQQEFLTAPLRAAVESAKAEQDKILAEAAQQQSAAYQRALRNNAFAGDGPAAPVGPQDPNEHGAPVTLHVTGYGARQVRQVAATELARADRQAAHMLVLQP